MTRAFLDTKPPRTNVEPDPEAVRAWIGRLSSDEKDGCLAGVFEGKGAILSLEMQHLFHRERLGHEAARKVGFGGPTGGG